MSASHERVVLITGASSGIGEALAEEYAARGAKVALLARRTDRIEALAAKLGGPERALAITCDVRVDGDLERATGAVLEAFGRIDVVVANAGFSVGGALEDLRLDDYRRQFETNVFGVLRTVLATLPAIKASRGRFALIGSIAGLGAIPKFTAYSMSKFAVRALAEALAVELAPAGVSVTHVAPGFVESEIRSVDNHGRLRTDGELAVASWIVEPRAKAAREIADAIDARRREAVITAHGKTVAFLSRHVPGIFYAALGLGRSLIPETRQSGG
jgi:NADP-dependent 3-hydroxy acid dehydrogenase YdfG